MWDNAAITTAGAALLAQAVGDNTLNIFAAAAGTETATDLQSMVSLSAQKQELSIVAVEKNGNNIKIQLQLTSVGNTQPYTLNQIGVWGSVGEQSALLAVYQNEDGILVPSESDMPDFVFTFYANIIIDNQTNITVSLDTSALVSATTLQSAIDNITVTGAASTVVKNDLSENKVVVTDEDGKLTDSDVSVASLNYSNSNLLLEPYFDAHSHRGVLVNKIYPDDDGLIEFCPYWAAQLSADAGGWSGSVVDSEYNGTPIKALFIDHPTEAAESLQGLYQKISLAGDADFTATIKLTFFATVCLDSPPETSDFTIRPYIANALSSAAGTPMTIPNDSLWHKISVTGTVSSGDIYIVLDSFPAEEAEQHCAYFALPRAEIVSLSEGAAIIETTQSRAIVQADGDFRSFKKAYEVNHSIEIAGIYQNMSLIPIPPDVMFDGSEVSGVTLECHSNHIGYIISGYIPEMTKESMTIGTISSKYLSGSPSGTAYYAKDGKWYAAPINCDDSGVVTVSAETGSTGIEFCLMLPRGPVIMEEIGSSFFNLQEIEPETYILYSSSYKKISQLLTTRITGSGEIGNIPAEDVNNLKIKVSYNYRPKEKQVISCSGVLILKKKSDASPSGIDVDFRVEIATDGSMRITNFDRLIAPYVEDYEPDQMQITFDLNYEI